MQDDKVGLAENNEKLDGVLPRNYLLVSALLLVVVAACALRPPQSTPEPIPLEIPRETWVLIAGLAVGSAIAAGLSVRAQRTGIAWPVLLTFSTSAFNNAGIFLHWSTTRPHLDLVIAAWCILPGGSRRIGRPYRCSARSAVPDCLPGCPGPSGCGHPWHL